MQQDDFHSRVARANIHAAREYFVLARNEHGELNDDQVQWALDVAHDYRRFARRHILMSKRWRPS